jgi:hypothetical protein
MTLKMISSWFRTMFTLKPGSSLLSHNRNQRDTITAPTDTEIIGLDEDSSTLEPLLRMICGFEIPTLDTWDAVEPVLYAAESTTCQAGPRSCGRPRLPTRPYGSMPRHAALPGQRTHVQLLRSPSRSTYTILCTSHHLSACARAVPRPHRRRSISHRRTARC